MKNKDDGDYEREGRSLMQKIAWETKSITEMEQRKDGHMSVLIHTVHPVLRDSNKYIPETGEILIDEDRYYPALAKVKVIDDACNILDICIKDATVWKGRFEEELEESKVDRLRAKVKRNTEKEHAEQFFAKPKQKGRPHQLQIDFE